MPHNGYRPFDIAACRAAFPDFSYTVLNDGLARAIRDESAVSGKPPAGVHARRVRS
jgi:hypothetical protein